MSPATYVQERRSSNARPMGDAGDLVLRVCRFVIDLQEWGKGHDSSCRSLRIKGNNAAHMHETAGRACTHRRIVVTRLILVIDDFYIIFLYTRVRTVGRE